MTLDAPVAKRAHAVRNFHGDSVVDDYSWMEDVENPEFSRHLEAEAAYTAAQTSGLATLRGQIYDEIKLHTLETDLTVPDRIGDWWYYSRSVEGESYELRCRCPIRAGDDWTPPDTGDIVGEEILVDCSREAREHDFYELSGFRVSPDGMFLAYTVDTVGDERYTLRIKDLRTGELLADRVDRMVRWPEWSRDGRHIFYITADESWRPQTVWRHEVATPTARDVEVHHESDPNFWVDVTSTRDKAFLCLKIYTQTTSEYRVLESDNPVGDFRVVYPRTAGVQYDIDHVVLGGVDRFLILHNADGKQNFELDDAPVADVGDRRTVVAHRDDVRLEFVSAFDGGIVLNYRRAGLARLAVMSVEPGGYGEARELEFDGDTYWVGFTTPNDGGARRMLRLSYRSFLTPTRIYDYEFATGAQHVRKAQVVPEFEPEEYVERREWAVASDGVRVPISVIARRDLPDGPAPTLLHGYGAYGAATEPEFLVERLSLLDRGVVFAVAHVRGGGELGQKWHDGARMSNKVTSFTDFVSCAEHLIETGVTTSKKLVAHGESAGGLLVAASMNMRPELFAAVTADVPLVDVLTGMLDPSSPLTTRERVEWGDPLAHSDAYRYIKSYSPYENIGAVDYPAVLATAALNDTRVSVSEPSKWVAALRSRTTGDNKILLNFDAFAGHGGVSGRYEQWESTAFRLAWILEHLAVRD